MLNFLKQDEQLEAFITGQAGTGKTTSIAKVVEQLVEATITFQVVAYTNKARDVLRSKLSLDDSLVTTLHSWLKKRPTINSKAKDSRLLTVSSQYGEPQPLQLLIVDEFSFIGEADYHSIGELQSVCTNCEGFMPCECSNSNTLHVLYVGDPNQLNPVDSYQAVIPNGDYWTKLTKVYRHKEDINITRLRDQLDNNDYSLPTFENTDMVTIVDSLLDVESDVILSFTNKMVQYYNFTLEGRDIPTIGSKVYIHTLKRYSTVIAVSSMCPNKLLTPRGVIDENTKYNPMRVINKIEGVKYVLLSDDVYVATIFGTSNYNTRAKAIGGKLVAKNKAKKSSKKEYHLYKTFSDYVVQMDFIHATTIHKSQGSEYPTISFDFSDLKANCINPSDIIRLSYVALSRAIKQIYIKI